MTHRLVGALASALLLLTGCQAHRGLEPLAPDVHDQGHLLYQARVERAGKGRRFRLALAVQYPDRFRLEVIGPVGGPRLVLISDGTVVQASLPSQRVFARGPAEAETLGILTGLPLAPEEFLDLLLGFPEPADQSAVLRAEPGGATQVRTSFEAGRKIARDAEVLFGASGEESALQVSYGEETQGPWGPQALELDLRQGETTLNLQLKEGSRGPVKPAAFLLDVPARFSELSLERLAESGTSLFGVEGGS